MTCLRRKGGWEEMTFSIVQEEVPAGVSAPSTLLDGAWTMKKLEGKVALVTGGRDPADRRQAPFRRAGRPARSGDRPHLPTISDCPPSIHTGVPVIWLESSLARKTAPPGKANGHRLV